MLFFHIKKPFIRIILLTGQKTEISSFLRFFENLKRRRNFIITLENEYSNSLYMVISCLIVEVMRNAIIVTMESICVIKLALA
jgi:hypothetical protein